MILKIMTENIELHSFRTPYTKYSDIEEYHEIVTKEFVDTPVLEQPEKTFNEFDFFSQHDVKTGTKLNEKKSRKKDKVTSLMDVISNELATVAVPVEKNVISIVDYTTEQRTSYLEVAPRFQQLFQRRRSHFDSEQGWSLRNEASKLNPIFPKILENITTEGHSIPVQYVKPVKYNEIIAEIQNDEKQRIKFLDIEIKSLLFRHHHLLSLEMLLCIKLKEIFKEYENLNLFLTDLDRDIKVNRETRDNLKHEFLKISPNKKEDIRFDNTVRKYTGNLLELKEKYLQQMQLKKEIMHRILSLWSDIEMVREKSGKYDTPELLIISHSNLSNEEYERQWNKVFNIEYSDLLDKVEYEYVSKYLEYKEVKYTQNLDDSAKRRINKPKLYIDEDALKEEVEEKVNKIVTKNQIDMNLKIDERILAQINNRAKGITENEYHFEIKVDDIFVCESDKFSCQINHATEIDLFESFSIQIIPKNMYIKIVLFENASETSSLSITLEDIKKSNANADFVEQVFVCNDIIEPNNKHVGSGYNIKEIAAQNKARLKSSNMFKGNLYTKCTVAIKMGWNEKYSQNQEEFIKNSMEVGQRIKRLLHGLKKPSEENLLDIIGNIYNKDVRNDVKISETLNRLSKLEVANIDTFTIDDNSPEYIRLKLLHLRNNGGMTNVENKMVPLYTSQLSIEHINCLQNSKENELDVQYLNDKYREMNPIEIQRFIGAKYVQKLNKNVLKNLNEHLLRKTHKDVVRDFKDLSLRALFSSQSKLSLANLSTGKKEQMLADALGREQQITVTVIRAFNLPDRSHNFEDIHEDEIVGFKVHPLRPFVRISYCGASAHTTAAIGCHPSWSHALTINAKLEPLSCLHVNVFDEYKTKVSDGSDDEVSGTVQFRYCNRWLGGFYVPLRSVLYLGTFRGTFRLTTPPILHGYENPTQNKDSNQSLIPAVNQLLKKDTSFLALQITTSLSHLGGLSGYKQPVPEDDYLINHINNFVTDYVNDFPNRNINLTFIDSSGKNKCVTQFVQPIIPPGSECFPKNPKTRSESALSKTSGLSKSSSSKSSSKSKRREERSYQEERESLYSTMSWRNGDNVLEKVMAACSRYVSLIPTYEVMESHTVTLMGVELLKVLHGSPLDHTILLASYYHYLGIRCWVAIGLAVPRAQSSFVLTKFDLNSRKVVMMNDQVKPRGFLSRNEGYTWYIHDACSGIKSELRDVACPLKTVDFVFDNENIWVNIQNSLDCESVNFDFTRLGDWRPVFDKTVFVMKQPVLSDSSLYCNSTDVETLRMALETKIKVKFQKWRSHVKTIWNRYCSALLRETLAHWEYWSFNTTDHKPGPNQRLKQLMVSYKLYGFPLNLPYVNTRTALATIKSTGMHSTTDPNVEFGLAVEVFPYPNNVLSVWVYLVSITRL